MKETIENYIHSKRYAWGELTMLNERYRLLALAEVIDGDPERLWGHLLKEGIKPYTRKQTWIAVSAFWDFASTGANPYRRFKKKNGRLFRHCYERRPAEMSVEECKKRIERIEAKESRKLAELLLLTGCRYSEFQTLKDGKVRGKGGKVRELAVDVKPYRYPFNRTTFYRHLKKVGLKPHDLRKIRASSVVEKGANLFELLAIFGWESAETAKSYIGVKKDRKKELMSG